MRSCLDHRLPEPGRQMQSKRYVHVFDTLEMLTQSAKRCIDKLNRKKKYD